MSPLPDDWRSGEIAVIGLGRSGRAAALLLRRTGAQVYASDAGCSGALEAGAQELRAAGIAIDIGRHDLRRIAMASLVVASPGVPPTSVPLVAARERGVPIVGEVEIALRLLDRTRVIAITGTNGKTTTTAITGHLLAALGHDAVAAGNIGTAVAEVALRSPQPAWMALEVSSFQLHDTPSIDPVVGVLTNLSSDHLDRYASVEEYHADKALLFRNAHADSHWVINGEDAAARAMASGVPGRHHVLALDAPTAEAGYDRRSDMLVVLGRAVLPRRELSLLGDHNVANALAALLAVAVADPAHRTDAAWKRLADGLRVFRSLPHRLEIVGERDGVLWINDSKATNVSSTAVAIAGMTRPTILLLGGRHKGEPYDRLSEPIRKVARHVLAYGEAAPVIAADLGSSVPVEQLGSSFVEVVNRARALTAPGDAVLLSPACSSFDMFENYEHRGAEFRRLALASPSPGAS